MNRPTSTRLPPLAALAATACILLACVLFALLCHHNPAAATPRATLSRPQLPAAPPHATPPPVKLNLVAQLGHSSIVTSVCFSPDDKCVLTGSLDNTARLWDAETGQEIKRFVGHTVLVESACFSPDGKRILTGSGDNAVRLWDVESGKEPCELISFDDGTWAVTDSAGRYDASNGGDVAGLHWVAGFEPIDLAQMKQRYYDPGLLAKYMGFNHEALKDVPPLQTVELYPQVEATPRGGGQAAVDVKLTDQGGGIGRVAVFVNDKLVAADARGSGGAVVDPNAAEARIAVVLSHAAGLMPGKANSVRIVAYNREGWLSSRGVTCDITPPGDANSAPPSFYAIVAGISDYASPGIHLNYPAKDAHDMAHALKLAAVGLFGADRVHVTLLSSDSAGGAIAATKANFRAAFDRVAKEAKPQDIFVIYLAGHGISLPGSDEYWYPTQDAATLGSYALADRSAFALCSTSSQELAEWANAAPPTHCVMVLDTCGAGAARAKLTETRAVSGDQIRALDRLKDNTGFYVLMGCSADAVSYEASQYGQGLLTYSLLEGMKGAALHDGAYLDVAQLFQYAENQVPELARDIGGIQRPQIAAQKDARSFDIGELDDSAKAQIPLVTAKPMVLQASLQDADFPGDDRHWSERLTEALREHSYGSARGSAAHVFVDAREMPGAAEVGGRYSVHGNAIELDLGLIRDQQRIALAPLLGSTDDIPGLFDRAVAAIDAALVKP